MQSGAAETLDPIRPAREWQARKLGQIAFGATVLFLAQLYLSPGVWFPDLEPLRLALVLSCVTLAAIAVHRLLSNKPIWIGWRGALLAVYCIAALISPLWSIDSALSIDGGLEVAKHFLFFLVVANTLTTSQRIRTALLFYAAASIVPGWGTFSNWWHDELLVNGFRGRWLGVMADPNHDCMALVGAVPLLLMFAAHGPGLWRRIVGAGGLTAVLMGIVATHSRGGSVGLAAAVLLWALMSKRKMLATTLTLVAAAGMLLFAPATFWQRNETIGNYEDPAIQGRFQAWDVAGRIFKERPLLGVGESAFMSAWKQYAPIDDPVEHPYVAHNLELEVLGQLGVVGLFGILGFIVCSLWSGWRARNGEMAHESRAVFAALVGYLVCQQFSGYSLSWFLYALCGFAACIDRYGGRKRVAKAAATETAVGAPLLAA
ncbi:MAG TPA: O-antigen ligase family protein [Myxococcales bacterium]|nr:O-antigen ligase family protein [Myxococcales bacterium]